MCGILGIKVNQVTPEVVGNIKQIFKSQEARGKLGCGVARLRNGVISRLRGTTASQLFEDQSFIAFWEGLRQGDLVIAHHRFATTGGNGYCIDSNHPIANEHKNIMLVHNGHIGGYTGIFQKLKSQGHRFETMIRTMSMSGFVIGEDITDSEVLVHLLEGGFVEQTINTFKDISGSYAIAFLKSNCNRIYLYRDISPLHVYEDSTGNIYFSSEFNDRDKYKNHTELKEGVLYAIGGSGLKYIKRVKEKPKLVYSIPKQTALASFRSNSHSEPNPYNYDDFDDKLMFQEMRRTKW